MIKVLVVGLVIVGATLGGSFYAIKAGLKSAGAEEAQPYFGGLDYVKTEPVGVPIIEDGVLEGYIVMQWVFTMEAKLRASMSVPVELILTDEAFRAVYSEVKLDFDSLDRIDFGVLTKHIRDNVNARIETPDLIKDVMVQKFDYVERGNVRDGKARSLIAEQPS